MNDKSDLEKATTAIVTELIGGDQKLKILGIVEVT